MRTDSRLERLRAWFRPPAARTTLMPTAERFATAQALLVGYYAVLFYFAMENIYAWPGYLGATDVRPRWPVFWLRWVDLDIGVPVILWCHVFGGAVALTLSGFRFARILVFASLLQFLAFKYSFGSINHGDHVGVLIAFVLIFLPRGWRSPGGADRHLRASTLLVFSAAQSIIMLTYSMSGAFKLGGAARQLLAGEVNFFAPTALAQQIAAKLLDVEATTYLGPILIDFYLLGWPMMILTLYLEVFALWAVFRPSLHRAWALGLIFFHLFSHLALGIGFTQNALWLALFFVLSPLRPSTFDPRQALRDLPLVGPHLPLATPPSGVPSAAPPS